MLGSVAWLPYSASLLGSIARLPCSAPLLGSLARLPCSASRLGFLCSTPQVGRLAQSPCLVALLSRLAQSPCSVTLLGRLALSPCLVALLGCLAQSPRTGFVCGHPKTVARARSNEKAAMCYTLEPAEAAGVSVTCVSNGPARPKMLQSASRSSPLERQEPGKHRLRARSSARSVFRSPRPRKPRKPRMPWPVFLYRYIFTRKFQFRCNT